MIHDFKECLEFSHGASDLPIWKQIYESMFPGCVMVDHRQDGYHQRAGIDRSLILPNSKQVFVDEKVRRKVYPDIALEFLHVGDNGKTWPGWVCKSLLADYIAYAIAPLGKGYLLPVLPLQAAFLLHGDAWRNRYFISKSPNRGYWTHCVCVPPKKIFGAICGAHMFEFSPIIEPIESTA